MKRNETGGIINIMDSAGVRQAPPSAHKQNPKDAAVTAEPSFLAHHVDHFRTLSPLLVLKPTGVASRPSQRVSNGWGQPLFHAPKNMNFADSAVECYKIPMLYKKRMKKGARTVEGGSTVEKFARS
jgi:hypothetical protein